VSPPPNQVAWAERYGRQYGVDPRLLLAIGGHETHWGDLGAGRQGYTLGYGVTDSGTLSKYRGPENQYRYAAMTLAKWGVRSIRDVLAGKAKSYATDPAWEHGVASVYQSLGGSSIVPGAVPAALPGAASPRSTPTPLSPGELARINAGFKQTFAGGGPQRFPVGVMRTATPELAPPLRRPATAPAPPPGPVGNNLAALATAQLGQPYVWGGESRREGGFDCSGLVDWALRQQGYKGPRVTTWTLAKMGTSVKGQPLQPGDLVLANNNKHVVIYAGNGRVIAAPHRGTVVQTQPLSKFRITDIRRL